MKLTGPACTKALDEAEEDGTRERAEDSAGGVRVELTVRPRRPFCRRMNQGDGRTERLWKERNELRTEGKYGMPEAERTNLVSRPNE